MAALQQFGASGRIAVAAFVRCGTDLLHCNIEIACLNTVIILIDFTTIKSI
jgi:hypothetical protein